MDSFSDEQRNTYIGSYLLVDVNYLDGEDAVTKHEQFHGIVEAITDQGIELSLYGARTGESFCLPPNLTSFSAAEPGIYALPATAESVEDPDFLALCEISESSS